MARGRELKSRMSESVDIKRRDADRNLPSPIAVFEDLCNFFVSLRGAANMVAVGTTSAAQLAEAGISTYHDSEAAEEGGMSAMR